MILSQHDNTRSNLSPVTVRPQTSIHLSHLKWYNATNITLRLHAPCLSRDCRGGVMEPRNHKYQSEMNLKVIMIYPQYPDTFWSFKHALKFISKKAAFPPLGLLTVASMMPSWCNKKLIDMNTSGLKDEDILWADYVFISAMSVQSRSTDEVIRRCNNLNIKVAGGGPHFTSCFENYNNVDYLILNEAEITLPQFFNDLLAGNPKHIYTTEDWDDITATPLPQWDLIPVNNYSSMNLQYSRGCPYNCDFCEITVLYGKRTRTKTK